MKTKIPKGYKKLRKPPSSLGAELSYLRQLRQYVRDLVALEKEYVFKNLDALVQIANFARPNTDSRQDGYVDDFERVMRDFEVAFYDKHPVNSRQAMSEGVFVSVENQNKRYYQKSVVQVAAVSPIVSEPWLVDEAAAFVKSNTKLITKMSEEHFARVEQATLAGLRDGKLTTDIAKDLEKQLKIPKNKAKLIARDQTSKLVSNLNQYRQKELGIKEYVWSTVGDNRVRDEHVALEGQVFSWDNPPSEGNPGEAINCRCVAIPIIKT